jgi:hypothetical protein
VRPPQVRPPQNAPVLPERARERPPQLREPDELSTEPPLVEPFDRVRR